MLDKAQAIRDFIVGVRRDIHRRPELGYREQATAALIARHLAAMGIPHRVGCARTGVLAEMTSGSGPTVLLRADMDALPIQEETGLSFASETPGVMHACGHDAHSAMLLGAARLLAGERFSGTVRLMFQPAEESNYDDPDGFSGAKRMMAEGAIADVAAAVGLHQVPVMPAGQIAITPGPVMAAADFFEMTVHGRSTHAGAMPQDGIDAIVIAAELIQSLQTIVSRQVGPTDTAVISVCTIAGGTAPNVLADVVRMSGTLRALDERTHQRLLALVQARCDGFAAMHGTSIAFRVTHGLPVTVNDPVISGLAAESATKVFGPANILTDVRTLAGEDFAYIAEAVPSCYALLGTKVGDGEAHPLHSPKMVINEDALPLGAAFLAQTALDLLGRLGGAGRP